MNRLVKDISFASAVYVDYLRHRPFVKFYNRKRKASRPPSANSIFPKTKLLFVHIPKTAGNSLRFHLQSVEDSYATRAGAPPLSTVYSKHAKAREIRELMGNDVYRDFFSFALVRNPWDLMASSYYWWRQYAIYFRSHIYTAALIRRMSFNEFISSIWGRHFINEQHGTMSDWFKSDGEDIVTYVGKVENIDKELAYIFDLLHLKTHVHAMGRANQTERPDYKTLYNTTSKNIVRDRFADVIDRFEYRF